MDGRTEGEVKPWCWSHDSLIGPQRSLLRCDGQAFIFLYSSVIRYGLAQEWRRQWHPTPVLLQLTSALGEKKGIKWKWLQNPD